LSKDSFSKIENYKACCCDERCGLVEKYLWRKQAGVLPMCCAVDFSAQLRKTPLIFPSVRSGDFLSTFRAHLSHALLTSSSHEILIENFL